MLREGPNHSSREKGQRRVPLSRRSLKLGQELLKRGLARVYRQGAQYDGSIERWNRLEAKAERSRVGMWGHGGVNPGAYKKAQKKAQKQERKALKRARKLEERLARAN